ncbi:hypothetical protein COY27_07135 [Candidatus Woesearchaeota archaeon CG_4_10_14_0_2_um_filter_33_13]|nr:MAG: hypothetical protein COY27_07135 [Candidatus Woesearchaeota archaeon CG_4_10_14_0_2_um_filter_33_13]
MLAAILSNKWVLYAIIGLFSLSIISNFIGNIKEMRKEPTYTKEAVELMIKHSLLEKKNEELLITNKILEMDIARLSQSIDKDSTIIHNSSRAYRDSLRNYIFNR